jgi:hypothetical protein
MLCLQSRSCISGKDFFENRDAFLNKETIQWSTCTNVFVVCVHTHGYQFSKANFFSFGHNTHMSYVYK